MPAPAIPFIDSVNPQFPAELVTTGKFTAYLNNAVLVPNTPGLLSANSSGQIKQATYLEQTLSEC